MTEPMIYHQAIKLPYRYTAGEANTAFLTGLVEQKILAGRCGACEITVAPLGPFCTNCGTKLEDPVEVEMQGLAQVQVNPKAGLTFGSALRSILRQDPDVVLVGETRDAETAQIVTQAALTGHLVATTLHTTASLSNEA